MARRQPRSSAPIGGADSSRAEPARPTRQRLDTAARREQLVETAKEFFGKRPYDQVKVAHIAAAAGVSEGLVYHYFPTKRELYVAVIKAASDELAGVSAPDPMLPPLQRLLASIDAFLDYLQANPEGYRSVHEGGIGSDPEVRAINRRSQTRHVDRIVKNMSAGAKTPPALRLAVRGWLGFMQAASLEWLQTRPMPRDQLRDLLAQVLIAAALVAWPQDTRPPEARPPLPIPPLPPTTPNTKDD